jgi:hypothetical protein
MYFTTINYSVDKDVLIFMVAASSVCIAAEGGAILSLKTRFCAK